MTALITTKAFSIGAPIRYVVPGVLSKNKETNDQITMVIIVVVYLFKAF